MLRIMEYTQSIRSKKVLIDCVLSFIGFAAPTIGLTFIIQPFMAKSMLANDYGFFLTVISVIRLFVNVGICTLANTRLLVQNKYDRLHLCGDFNILFSLISTLASIIILCVMLINDRPFCEIFLTTLVIILIMFHDYVTIEYRINLNFKRILIDNIIMLFGYIIGAIIFSITNLWQFVFISGYLSALLYVIPTTSLWREPFRKTSEFPHTTRKYTQFMASSAMSDSINYCDRILIYPMLGGFAVSSYNAAAVIGKAVQLINVPIQRVIFSYIAKSNNLQYRLKIAIVVVGAIIFTIAYAILYYSSIYLIPLMYPQFYDAAIIILPIVIAGVIINTYASLINMFVMRFDKASYQVKISTARIVSYLSICLIFTPLYGINAFCYGILISSIVQFLFVLIKFLNIKFRIPISS